ncbi:MAG: hypothetical protein D3923_07870, partial [Candidatus Electrothrix sp. AR3]|nr:hypothetical protein [Candidatus Electrothrix sp. AR3]
RRMAGQSKSLWSHLGRDKGRMIETVFWVEPPFSVIEQTALPLQPIIHQFNGVRPLFIRDSQIRTLCRFYSVLIEAAGLFWCSTKCG